MSFPASVSTSAQEKHAAIEGKDNQKRPEDTHEDLSTNRRPKQAVTKKIGVARIVEEEDSDFVYESEDEKSESDEKWTPEVKKQKKSNPGKRQRKRNQRKRRLTAEEVEEKKVVCDEWRASMLATGLTARRRSRAEEVRCERQQARRQHVRKSAAGAV